MSQGKGKEKANSNRPDSSDTISSNMQASDSESPSLLSRITESARGLTQSAVASTPSDANKTFASALSTGEKGQASRGAGSQIGGTTLAENRFQSHHHSSTPDSQSFRSSHQDEHVKDAEKEFSTFLDGIDSFRPSEENDPVTSSQSFDNAWSKFQTTQDQTGSRAVSEQQALDGSDVVTLLSSKSAIDEYPLAQSHEDEANFDWGLSAEQLTQLRALTSTLLPPPEPHGKVSVDDPLNLIPKPEANTASELMGHSEVSAMQQWREQWEGVLTRYTDEVWGGLLPLVKEARKEVEEMKDHPAKENQPKALRRLQAILGHLSK